MADAEEAAGPNVVADAAMQPDHDTTNSQGRSPANAENSFLKQHFVGRQVAEVFLLLDNISATKDKKLPDGIANDVFAYETVDGKPKDWLQQIAEIHFPPSGSDEQLAVQSAKLYRARDALNAAAAPATSATIAFTLLVSNGTDSWPSMKPRWSFFGLGKKPDDEEGEDGTAAQGGHNPRRELALQAFPSFERPARSLSLFTKALVTALAFWLMLTSAVSWDVATGSALLSQVAALDTRLEEIDKRITDISPGSVPGDPSPSTVGGSGDSAKPEESSQLQATQLKRLEADRKKLKHERNIALENIKPWLLSKEKSCLVFKVDILRGIFGSDCQKSVVKAADAGEADTGEADTGEADTGEEVNWHWAAVLIAILANNVLPIMYGVLGAMASVARNISASTRDYLLSPRQLPLSLIQLALGAVIGAAIGLFLPSQTTTDTSAANWLSSVYLSASALCFLAGFGVEGVFQSLEALVARIFNLAPPNTKAD